MRGLSYFKKSSFNKAISDFSRVIELDPKSDGSYYWRGCSYYEKGSFDEAISDFSRAIELDPKGARSYHRRGWSYYMKSRFNEAISDFNRTAEKTDPKNTSALRSALRGKAFSYLGLGDGESAVGLIKKAKNVSDYPEYAADLTRIYYLTGDMEKAWEMRGGRGWIGLAAKDFENKTVKGAMVDGIIPGGPAEKSGIITGDIILGLNEDKITNVIEFVEKARMLNPGASAKIEALREGLAKMFYVRVGSPESQIESDPIIAPIAAKRRLQPGAAPSRAHVETASAALKSDVEELPTAKATFNRNAYAIVIGIETYRQKLPKADFAVHDARTVTDYLTKVLGYPQENVVTLVNDRAAKSDFEKYFEKWLSNNVEGGGRVFIFYSGHGAPNPKTGHAYMVPYDGDPSFIDQTGYSLKRLYEALGKLPAKEIIVVLDSCFSGAGGRGVIAKGARPLVMMTNSAVIPGNATVISAATGDQISMTYDEKGHGLFTYFMLKGLKSMDVVKQDGSIEIAELFDYVRPQVERIARKQYNNEQTPQLIMQKKR